MWKIYWSRKKDRHSGKKQTQNVRAPEEEKTEGVERSKCKKCRHRKRKKRKAQAEAVQKVQTLEKKRAEDTEKADIERKEVEKWLNY